mgnify:FL=1
MFRTNHRLTVLNDVVDGNVWNPSDSTKVIKIQWNTIQTEQTAQQKQNDQSANNQCNFNKTCSAQSGQIKAQDDEIGAARADNRSSTCCATTSRQTAPCCRSPKSGPRRAAI